MNETIEFIVRYESEEEVTVIWYCNRRQVRQSSAYALHADRRMARLTVNRVQMEHAGEYTVEVVNSAGKTVSTGKLTVVRKEVEEDEEEQEQQEKAEKKAEKKKQKKEEVVEDVEMEDVSEEVFFWSFW